MFLLFVETSHCGVSHPRSSLKMLYAHGRRHGVTSLRVLDVGGKSVKFMTIFLTICCMNRFYKITFTGIFVLARFGGFYGLFRALSHLKIPSLCGHFCGLSPREGLTAFPERGKPLVFACTFCPEKLPVFCRKGLIGLQRGRCQSAAAAPSHRRKGPAGEPGGPYGRTDPVLGKNGGRHAVCKWL